MLAGGLTSGGALLSILRSFGKVRRHCSRRSTASRMNAYDRGLALSGEYMLVMTDSKIMLRVHE